MSLRPPRPWTFGERLKRDGSSGKNVTSKDSAQIRWKRLLEGNRMKIKRTEESKDVNEQCWKPCPEGKPVLIAFWTGRDYCKGISLHLQKRERKKIIFLAFSRLKIFKQWHLEVLKPNKLNLFYSWLWLQRPSLKINKIKFKEYIKRWYRPRVKNVSAKLPGFQFLAMWSQASYLPSHASVSQSGQWKY